MKSGMRALAICLASAGLALAIGCRQYERDQWVAVAPGDQTGDVTLYRDVHFEDIPVPAEYVLVSDDSYSFQGAQIRNGVFHYQGRLEWTAALDFYRVNAPALGWTLLSTEKRFDFRVLRFAKGAERMIVVVRQIRNGSRAEIQIDNAEKNDLLLKGRLPSS